jgi:two-component system LytT family sensor kinase
VKTYDLIFSNQRSYRIRRHLLFWVIWSIYLLVTYLIPTNWIPAWDFSTPMTHIEKYGLRLFILRIGLTTTILVLLHMCLVYGIIYFILPRYLSKNKNRMVTTIILVMFVCTIAFIYYFNFILSFYLSTQVRYFTQMPDMAFTIAVWGRNFLFNVPTVVGFAVAIKLLKNWYIKQKETEQVVREKFKAELQVLKAQVHPHFLFNTLNNIYSFILRDSPTAPEMIKKLTALLRYLIHECNQPLVQLEKELKMIADYISLEKIRYGDDLNISLQVQGNPGNKMVFPLLFIPFVENSFKHGASRMLTHPWVNLDISIEEHVLHFKLSNSKPGWESDNNMANGIGLDNVKKRLNLVYPGQHSLNISESDLSFDVSLKIPVFKPVPQQMTEIMKPAIAAV